MISVKTPLIYENLSNFDNYMFMVNSVDILHLWKIHRIYNTNQLFYKDKQEKKNLPIKIISKNNSRRSESTKKKRNKKKNVNNILKTKQRRKYLLLLKITFRSSVGPFGQLDI